MPVSDADISGGAFTTGLAGLPIPRPTRATVVAGPPGAGPGYWAGAPSAVRVGGVDYLAYRLRRPVGQGRGSEIVVERLAEGERLEPLVTLHSGEFDAESLERPVLAVAPDGMWRLYVSCATPGTKHWRIEMLEATDPSRFRADATRVVVPGDEGFGVKDPVVVRRHGTWHMWACFHPLEPADEADRMQTRYAISPDGIRWRWVRTTLSGRPGHWDARGVRFTSVLFRPDHVVAYYDGRASKDENYEERTGLAVSPDGVVFHPVGDAPVGQSQDAGGGLRYLTVLPLAGGRHRLYYEHTRADGAHDLLTEVVDAASPRTVTSPPAARPRVSRRSSASH